MDTSTTNDTNVDANRPLENAASRFGVSLRRREPSNESSKSAEPLSQQPQLSESTSVPDKSEEEKENICTKPKSSTAKLKESLELKLVSIVATLHFFFKKLKDLGKKNFFFNKNF